ncbi:MAG: DUF6567 family protein [Bacteroidota bacterium]
MMRRLNLIITLVISAVLVSACGNSGAFLASNTTEVHLKEANYNIVATNMSGMAETSYVIGASVSWGPTTNSYGLIPLGEATTTSLYKDAQDELWANIREAVGDIENRQLALVNVRYDASTANYFFYTWAKITVTADVIEFR